MERRIIARAGTPLTQLTLFGATINVIPICAMELLWASWRQSAGLIFAAFFAVVLTIGVYEHFWRAGADRAGLS